MSLFVRIVRALAWMSAGVLVGDAPGMRADPFDILASVDRAALMVHVEDGAGLRRTRCGVLLLELGGGVSRFDDLRRRWQELSRQLGMDEEEAFDALLGTSCGLVRDSLGADGTWVVLSEVSDETGRRVLSRLRGVPKRAVEGVPIVAIESGRVHAAIVGRGRSVLLVLGERTDTALFQEVLARARESEQRQADRHGAVHLRIRGRDGVDAEIRCDLTVTREGARVEADLSGAGVRRMLAGIPDGAGMLPSVASDDGALLGFSAFVDMRQFERVLGVPAVVRVRDDRPGLGEFGPAVFVRMYDDGGPARVQLGVQVRHWLLSADKGDALLVSLLARLSRSRMPSGDFGGLAPGAVRISEIGRVEGLSDEGASLAWTYRGPDARGRSWLLAELAETGEVDARRLRERFDEMLETLASSSGERGALAVGWVRLGDLLSRTGSGEQDSSLGRAFGLIERASICVRREGPQRIRIGADLSIR